MADATLKVVQRTLKARHEFYGIWQLVADELKYSRGTLYSVSEGKRRPPNKLIDAMNKVYGLHLPYAEITIKAIPCQIHGIVHEPRRCPSAPTKYAPHPVMRVTKVQRLMAERDAERIAAARELLQNKFYTSS